jgi:hypothetical protein
LIVEPKLNEVEKMIIQIKYLIDLTPLPHLILREETNYNMEMTQPLEQQAVKYKDKSSQTEDAYSILKKKQIFLEYNPLLDVDKTQPKYSTTQLK